MALEKIPTRCTFTIKVQSGLNMSGNPVYKTYNYSNVKTDAADANIYAVASGLGALQSLPVISYSKADYSQLVDMI